MEEYDDEDLEIGVQAKEEGIAYLESSARRRMVQLKHVLDYGTRILH